MTRSPFARAAYRAAYRAQAEQRIRRQVAAARSEGRDPTLDEAARHLDQKSRSAFENAPDLAEEAMAGELAKRLAYATIYARQNRSPKATT